jgi:hypothetical protein
MVTSAISENYLEVYPKTVGLSSERRPFAAGTPEGNQFERQKTTRKESGFSAYIDVQAESVADVQVSSQNASLPPDIPSSGQKDRGSNPESSDHSTSFAALQYTPSKKLGGGIEFRYDSQSRGRAVDLMA